MRKRRKNAGLFSPALHQKGPTAASPDKEDKGPVLGAPLPSTFVSTSRKKANRWAPLCAYETHEMIYVHAFGEFGVRRSPVCVLPLSMKYFHWFHGQQTRLHDANNTLHDAMVPFTSLPRGRCGSNKKEIEGWRGRGRKRGRARELNPRSPSPSSCPPRNVSLTNGRRTLQNVID